MKLDERCIEGIGQKKMEAYMIITYCIYMYDFLKEKT